MTPPEWERVKGLFEQAIELPADGRASFLADACGGDEALRTEVEALLRAHESAGGFLETPAAAQLPLPPAGGGDGVVGRLVGPFRVIAEIGRGGMGAVYRARREGEEYTQEVALKLVPTRLDSARFTARFRQERRILARLEHPNIARLIDGGTTDDGRPYYAMEFVDGRPLDAYCVEQGLGLRTRLELFCTVCDAIAYAHRNLVVHRDLKPSNILVSASGEPKLLDFGIAKLLSAEDASEPGLTETGMSLMTPEYASPEQVRGDPVTTSTDVYALGVLLYLLLTDRRPYELTTRSAVEIVRVVCHEEPIAPSTFAAMARRAAADARARTHALSWRISSDLDTIVLKALRKEPDRRYASAADLADDIRRCLKGLPIRARPDTFRYRTSRFVSRHRGAVAAAVVAALSLIGGLGATTYQARIAEANRLRAEKRFQDVRRIANSLVFELHDSIADIAGATAARELVLRRASELLDTLAADAPADPVLAEEVAGAYHRLGDALWSSGESSLGKQQAALAAHRKGLAVRAELARAAPGNPDRQDLLASSHINLSYATADEQEGLEHARTAAGIASRVASAFPANAGYQRRLANAMFAEGVQLVQSAQAEEAIGAFEQAAAAYERLLAREPGNRNLLRNAALTRKRIGAILTKQRRYQQALDHYRKAVEADEASLAKEPSSATARYDLSVSLVDLAVVLGLSGDWEGEYQQATRALALREELGRADPNNAEAKRGIASALGKIAAAALGLSRHEEAIGLLRRGLALCRPSGEDLDLSTGLELAMAEAQAGLRHWDESIRSAAAALEGERRLIARRPANSWLKPYELQAELALGNAFAGRAAQPGRASNLAASDWRAAHATYQSALSRATLLEKQQVLVGADAGLPEKARKGLERSARALAGK